jgi:hypothetical protein
VAADPAARDRKAELLTVGPVALARVKVEAGKPQPADGEVLEEVPGSKDPERPAFEFGAFVLRRLGVLELERAIAGHAEAGAAQIIAGRRGSVLGLEARVDQVRDELTEAGPAIEVEHQPGRSVSAWIR